jgi:chromate transporter
VILWRLASIMSVLSLFSFGGANGVLPQMHADVVDQQHWLTSAQFARFWALGGLVPGPTLTAGALIGFYVAGLLGALVAAVALFVPAGVIDYALGVLWARLHAQSWRDHFAAAIAPVVIGLVWAGCVPLARGAIDGWLTGLITVVAGTLLVATRVNRALIMLCAAAAGYVWFR